MPSAAAVGCHNCWLAHPSSMKADISSVRVELMQQPLVLQVRVPRAAAVKGKVAVHLSGLEADINVLRRLKHPNIVRYLVSCPAPEEEFIPF